MKNETEKSNFHRQAFKKILIFEYFGVFKVWIVDSRVFDAESS